MRSKIITILCIVAAIAVGGLLLRQWHRNRDLESRVRDLQVQLAKADVPMKRDTVVLHDKDTVEVVTQRVVEIDKTDYKQQVADRELIKELNMKVSQIEAENRMLRETHDSVTLQPVKSDSDSIFAYHDHWADFTVNIRQRSLNYIVRDSLASFIERIPRHRFLWLRWGTKGYNLKHVNFNPHSRIEYNSVLIIKR